MRAPTPSAPPAASDCSAASPTSISLSRGQSYHLWSGRDAVVWIRSGTLHLRESPYWIGDTMLGIQLDLQAGQHYLIQRSGWACLTASSDAEILYYSGPALGQVSLTTLWQAMRRLSRCLPQQARRWLVQR